MMASRDVSLANTPPETAKISPHNYDESVVVFYKLDYFFHKFILPLIRLCCDSVFYLNVSQSSVSGGGVAGIIGRS